METITKLIVYPFALIAMAVIGLVGVITVMTLDVLGFELDF